MIYNIIFLSSTLSFKKTNITDNTLIFTLIWQFFINDILHTSVPPINFIYFWGAILPIKFNDISWLKPFLSIEQSVT